MKKFISILVLTVMACSPVFAAQKGTPEYDQLKVLKTKQREERAQKKANPVPKEKNFWQREAERSGLAGTSAMFTGVIAKAIPLEAPNSRKTN